MFGRKVKKMLKIQNLIADTLLQMNDALIQIRANNEALASEVIMLKDIALNTNEKTSYLADDLAEFKATETFESCDHKFDYMQGNEGTKIKVCGICGYQETVDDVSYFSGLKDKCDAELEALLGS